jgi:transposase
VEVHVLHKQGKGVREIARATGFPRNTVRAVLRGQTDKRYGPRQPMPSDLDPYKEFLKTLRGRRRPTRSALNGRRRPAPVDGPC